MVTLFKKNSCAFHLYNLVSTQLLTYSLWLGHANSAANPLLYCLFSRNIRQSLQNLFQPNNRNSRHSSELVPMTQKRRNSVCKR